MAESGDVSMPRGSEASGAGQTGAGLLPGSTMGFATPQDDEPMTPATKQKGHRGTLRFAAPRYDIPRGGSAPLPL